MYKICTLFFAHEDREQITWLVLETLRRLNVATGDILTSKQLWNNVYAFMTDAVTKKLKVEVEVSQALETGPYPYIHILYVNEKLNESCVNALIQVEQQLKMADKCIAICAMTTLLKLVARDESRKPTSLAKEFHCALEKEGF